ncbi:hypothetical protein SUGI_0605290 [Cryptomeria japonica]|uniref:zinc finger protein CONSTANS-LIKE 4 n=1 Tax=Cryptomeria japonica TaxID=3369 RepID=UPI0024147DF8|nr:zinc finger protein CONSTANS-LIKE 4 [Cryptomeria japonica]GLJ30570.1 hypothetical protein SUGI_0605290 [Cryptomeria japonica]
MVKEEEEDWHSPEEWDKGSQEDHKDFLRGIRGWRMSVPKLCDVCQVSSSELYCRDHTALICMVCDVRIHGGGANNKRVTSSLCHERVWLCEVCEQAPASVTCKADAAALCEACDSDIHSANPLARRHERVPVTPFYECPNVQVNNNTTGTNAKYSFDCNDILNEDGDGVHLENDEEEDNEHSNLLHHRTDQNGNDTEMCSVEEVSAVPWLIPETNKSNLRAVSESGEDDEKTVKEKLKFKAYLQSIDFLHDVGDPYVGLEYLASNETTSRNCADAVTTLHMGTDSMVPVHSPEVIEHSSTKVSNDSGSLDADVPKGNYVYRTPSLNHSASSSSMEVGIVPESSINEIPGHFSDPIRGSFEIPPRGFVHPGSQLESMGREARVLRYREKRKNRKFEKTIRYASRKAYAETRPRIKGRFAKRTDVEEGEGEGEVEQMYSSSSSLISDQGYGVVPSY